MLVVTSAALLASAPLAFGASVTPAETRDASAWVAAKILAEPAEPAKPGIVVVANNDAVWPNGRGDKPMHLAGAEHTRGIYCHANSKLVANLPGPARSFSAVVGVDSNEQTSGGRGSVVFSVRTARGELFRSEVLREGMPPVPVELDLGGASTLTLEVGDSGDGISCDQSDWAEALVVLEDGTEVWLGDLPIEAGVAALTSEPFFSFVYDGKPSSELLPGWGRTHTSGALDEQRTEHTLTYTDPATGLELRVVAVEYHDFPTVEWTLYLRNTGTADTPILESILPLDTDWTGGPAGQFALHHNVGSPCSASDFAPLVTPLGPGASKRISAAGGRPTNTDMCYFNLEWGGQGRIVAIGWPGQWSSDFVRDNTVGIRTRAGQELTHLKLLPGEEIRTPLVVVQFWNGGDWVRAQNVWRRWMMAHSMPRPGGQLPRPAFRASSSRAYEEMIGANEENQIMHIDRYAEEDLGLDTWWMDAGWYPQEHGWPQVGTWEADTKRFPHGFKEITKHAHEKGMEVLVWFEPERVAADTWLTKNHPEWILGGAGGGLLNLGNPEAQSWLVEHIDSFLTEQGIDTYRQDFNMDPLGYWRGNDAPDRQGITEIRHIEGLLAYWDALIARHPNMLLDTCASGGRRLDVETLRRAVPLWRSDYAFEPTGEQAMTYGLSMWVPYHGTGTVAYSGAAYYGGGATPIESYAFWSNVTPSLGSGIDLREKGLDYPKLRKLLGQWRELTRFYYDDFYPLTPHSLDNSQWIAWQFDSPERGEGIAQAFRRKDSIYRSGDLRLSALDPDATYEVQDLDKTETTRASGRELLETGLTVTLDERPSAAVIRYRKVQ